LCWRWGEESVSSDGGAGGAQEGAVAGRGSEGNPRLPNVRVDRACLHTTEPGVAFCASRRIQRAERGPAVRDRRQSVGIRHDEAGRPCGRLYPPAPEAHPRRSLDAASARDRPSRAFPGRESEALVTAWLWSDQAGVISHQTALSLHGLSDVLPAQVRGPERFARTPRRRPSRPRWSSGFAPQPRAAPSSLASGTSSSSSVEERHSVILAQRGPPTGFRTAPPPPRTSGSSVRCCGGQISPLDVGSHRGTCI
jgi:hypothetical protein